MRCPWCGSPVEIRGSSWECGWCGDFGSLQRTPARKSPNTAQITLTLSFVYRVDLPETWSNLKKALGQIAPKNTSLLQLLGKVLLHHISAGIQHVGALPDEKKAEELRTFLHNTPDLNLGKSADETMRDAKRGVLFREEAALSETDCGTFWTELFSTRPVEDYYNLVDPDGLFELLSELSSAYAYFSGKKDEEMVEAQDYQNALEEAYNTHWQNKVLLHPDIEHAKRLLAQGKFPDYEDICREILLVEYPEEVPHETAEDFDELSWNRILDDVFADDPEKGMEMWRRILDIAELSLKTDPKIAEKLLPDWDWLESPTDDQALPLLVALDDERFVSQLFESAHIGRLQLDVLNSDVYVPLCLEVAYIIKCDDTVEFLIKWQTCRQYAPGDKSDLYMIFAETMALLLKLFNESVFIREYNLGDTELEFGGTEIIFEGHEYSGIIAEADFADKVIDSFEFFNCILDTHGTLFGSISYDLLDEVDEDILGYLGPYVNYVARKESTCYYNHAVGRIKLLNNYYDCDILSHRYSYELLAGVTGSLLFATSCEQTLYTNYIAKEILDAVHDVINRFSISKYTMICQNNRLYLLSGDSIWFFADDYHHSNVDCEKKLILVNLE